MIIKKITMNDGGKYTIGFKEVGSNGELIECHVLEKKLLKHKSLYCYSRLKGLSPDYRDIAIWTIMKYREDLEQREKLLNANWEKEGEK